MRRTAKSNKNEFPPKKSPPKKWKSRDFLRLQLTDGGDEG
jgi:hypothetical protein